MTERSEDALKACPFCGGDDENLTFYEATDLRPDYKGHVWGRTISCTQCGISMSDEYEDELIAAWNTRSEASPPVIDEGVVERVAKAVEPFVPGSRKQASSLRIARAALEAGCAGLVAENARYRTMLDTLSRRAALVMQMLEDDGPQVVPHLIDTDDNPGQYLRVAIDTARTALRGDREQGEG